MRNVKIVWVLNPVTSCWVCTLHESLYDPSDRLIGCVDAGNPELESELKRITKIAAEKAFGREK